MAANIDDAAADAAETLKDEFALDVTESDVEATAMRVRDAVALFRPKRLYAKLTTVADQGQYAVPTTDIAGNAIEGRAVEVFYDLRGLPLDVIDVIGYFEYPATQPDGQYADQWETILAQMLQDVQGDMGDRARPFSAKISADGQTIELEPYPTSATDYLVVMTRARTDDELTTLDWDAVVKGTVGRWLRREAAQLRSMGGFRAGAYATTSVADLDKSWKADADRYLSELDGYLLDDAYAQVVTR